MPSPYVAWENKIGVDPLLLWATKTHWADFPETLNELTRTLAIKYWEPISGAPDFPEAGEGDPVFRPLNLNADAQKKLFSEVSQQAARDTRLRLELAMFMAGNRTRTNPFDVKPIQPCKTSPARSTIYFGVIDDGCPYARGSFVRYFKGVPESRVIHLWNQNPTSQPQCVSIPYGAEVDLSLNQLAALGEDEVYAASGYEPARRAYTHGAHVLDLVAGNRSARSRLTNSTSQTFLQDPSSPADLTSDADIGFVQLPVVAISDTSGLWLAHYVLDAIEYLLAGVTSQETVVLNISFGPLQGPHDGTSFFEEALAAKVQNWRNANPKKRLEIVLPAGNNYDTRTHASMTVQPGTNAKLTWVIPPNSEKSAFLEIWIDKLLDPSKISIQLVSPNQTAITCKVNEAQYFERKNNRIYAGLIFTGFPARSTEGLQALIVTTPTDAPDNSRELAPSGRWRIIVSNGGQEIVHANLYIARNGVTLLRKRRGKQSYFLDSQYDPERYLRPEEDDSVNPHSAVRRRGTLSGIATGAGAHVVSGYRMRNVDNADFYPPPYNMHGPQQIRDHPSYSSAGPSRNGQGLPDGSAPSDYSRTLRGIPAGGGRGRSVFWMIGTSTAAPQFARALALNTFANLPDRLPISGTLANELYSTKYVK